MSNYYITIAINDLQSVKNNIADTLGDIQVLNKKLNSSLMINNKPYKKEIIDSIINDLYSINTSITSNIIPRLKSKISD